LYDKKCPPSDACTNKGGTCVKDCAFGAACDPDICEEEGCLCQVFPVSCPFDDLCSLKNGECIDPCVAGVGQDCDKELCGLDNNCACLYDKKCPPSDECTNKGGECVKKCVQGGECIKEYCKGDDCFCDFKPVVLCKVQASNSCQVERNGSCQKPCIPGVDEECDTNLCQSAKYCGCLYKKCPPSEECTTNGGTCVTECKGANCVKEWCDGDDCSCQVFPVSCSVQPGDVACSKKKGTCVKPCIASKGQGCDQKLCEGKGCGCLYDIFLDEVDLNSPN